MLPLRGAREQHRREIQHQHEHEDYARRAEHNERRSNAREDIDLKFNRIQLEAAAAEIASIDGAADGPNRGAHCGR